MKFKDARDRVIEGTFLAVSELDALRMNINERGRSAEFQHRLYKAVVDRGYLTPRQYVCLTHQNHFEKVWNLESVLLHHYPRHGQWGDYEHKIFASAENTTHKLLCFQTDVEPFLVQSHLLRNRGVKDRHWFIIHQTEPMPWDEMADFTILGNKIVTTRDCTYLHDVHIILIDNTTLHHKRWGPLYDPTPARPTLPRNDPKCGWTMLELENGLPLVLNYEQDAYGEKEKNWWKMKKKLPSTFR